MGENRKNIIIREFWQKIRKGKKARQDFAGFTARAQQMDFGTTPSALAAHRARLVKQA